MINNYKFLWCTIPLSILILSFGLKYEKMWSMAYSLSLKIAGLWKTNKTRHMKQTHVVSLFKCYEYKKLGKQERNHRICTTLAGWNNHCLINSAGRAHVGGWNPLQSLQKNTVIRYTLITSVNALHGYFLIWSQGLVMSSWHIKGLQYLVVW